MITIGICDDEVKMRKTLRPILERTLQLQGVEYKIAEYVSGEALLEKVVKKEINILFLDIEMGNLNGIEIAKILRKKEQKTIIIFVTAYPDFVFQGYEVHAFHYILKPYEEKKIKRVMEQALKELSLIEEQFFIVEQKSKTLRISLKETIVFKSERRKVSACVGNEIIGFYGKLDEIEHQLPDYFVRIHNRYLVNLNFITEIEKDRCVCGIHIFPISRAFKQNLEVAFARLLLK